MPGDVVLVLWTDIGEATEQFQQVVHQLQASVGGYSKTSTEVIFLSMLSGGFPTQIEDRGDYYILAKLKVLIFLQ